MISVIIPVYNVEKYIRKCLDSVVNQTYKNLEIIIVDDGSPDKCGSIIDEYADNDKRIKVIHKANGGLSAARNDALRIATGDWIAFVDSDDWCETDMYEKVICKAEEENADIVIFNPFRNYTDREEILQAFPYEFVTEDRDFIHGLQLSALTKHLTPLSTKWSQGFPWDKLFKRSLIYDNNLIFDEGVKANEDVIFDIRAFQFAKKIAYVNETLYHYRDNPNSIGTKYSPDRFEIDKEIYRVLFSIGEEYRLPASYYQGCYIRVVTNTYLALKRCVFHKKNNKSFKDRIRFLNVMLRSEPIRTAFEKIDRRHLTLKLKVCTLFRHPNAIWLWMLYVGNVIAGRR